MVPSELAAKSPRKGSTEALSLEQHLLDTEQAAALLFSDDHRVGQNFRQFFKIPKEDHPRFLLHVRIAGLLHDLGKANEGFARAVRGEKEAQVVRHEHLSALILHLPEVRVWLDQNPTIDWEVITAAVLAHHVKVARPGPQQKRDCPGFGQPLGLVDRVPIYLSAASMQRIFLRLAQLASLQPPKPISRSQYEAKSWNAIRASGLEAADDLAWDLRKNRPRAALLAAVKAGVIAADAVASGLFRVEENLPLWLSNIVRQPDITREEVFGKIISPRLASIGQRSNTKAELQPFQRELSAVGARVLLLAGCGMGKTLAAWCWAAAQATTRRFSKVIFLYPTRGTATEGFRDYVGWAPETEASLVHSSAKYELQELLKNPGESTAGKHYETEDDRLFALGLWSRRFFSATVDQFLGFLEHQYSSLCLLPALSDSVVIVDEVHSFDAHMFDLLLAFLKALDVPVLCMTATLPKARRNALVGEAGLTLFPSLDPDSERSDATQKLQEAESIPRYQHEPLPDKDAAIGRAVSAYRKGLRVLWVVNTVNRCQDLVRELSAQLGERVFCYHSRFRLSDRRDRHEDVLGAFAHRGGESTPAIAVTTQVCEMSLDLDADVLLTEWAPVSSLVQRFGRANRHLRRGPGFRATLHTYRPPHPLPYDREELAAAESFLAALSLADLNQRELCEKLLLHSPSELPFEGLGPFLSNGYFAEPGPFRDADERSRPAVLASNLEEVRACLRKHQPLDQFVLPVPQGSPALLSDPTPDWLPNYLRICDPDFYRPDLGLCTERLP